MEPKGDKEKQVRALREAKFARGKQAEKAATINKAATIKEATVKLAATINAIPAHKGKGRPSTGKALSVAERSRRYREERKRKNETG
jgi:hypothetical protein